MVDLVKIRKKAREQKGEAGESSGEQTVDASGESQAPETESAPRPKPQTQSSAGSPGVRSPKGKTKRKAAKQQKKAEKRTDDPVSESPSVDPTSVVEPEPAKVVDTAPARAEASTEPARTEDDDGESRLSRFKRTAGLVGEEDSQEDGGV